MKLFHDIFIVSIKMSSRTTGIIYTQGKVGWFLVHFSIFYKHNGPYSQNRNNFNPSLFQE